MPANAATGLSARAEAFARVAAGASPADRFVDADSPEKQQELAPQLMAIGDLHRAVAAGVGVDFDL